MLLYFSVGGFCSFKDTQDLFLTAYSGTRLKNTKYEKNFYIDKNNRVMKSAVVFGANASGKTNLILGIERLKEIIFNGINLPKDFNEKNLNYDSESIKFEIGILDQKKNVYDYSIEFQKEKLIYEKLGFFPRLIERGYLPLSAQSIFLLNPWKVALPYIDLFMVFNLFTKPSANPLVYL